MLTPSSAGSAGFSRDSLRNAVVAGYANTAYAAAVKLLERRGEERRGEEVDLKSQFSDARLREISLQVANAVLNDVLAGKLQAFNIQMVIKRSVEGLLLGKTARKDYFGSGTDYNRYSVSVRAEAAFDRSSSSSVNTGLCEAFDVCEKDPMVREYVLELARTALKSRFVPEAFNYDSQSGRNAKLSFDSGTNIEVGKLNDLAGEFILWFAEHILRDQENGRVKAAVLTMYLFYGEDENSVYKKLTEMGDKDGVSYVSSPEQVDQYYNEVLAVFENPESLNPVVDSFFAEASFNDSREKDYMDSKAYRSLVKTRSEIGRAVVNSERSQTTNPYKVPFYSRDILKAEKKGIEFPMGHLDRFLEAIDILMYQRGDLTARNKAFVNVMRLIDKMSGSNYANYMVGMYGVFNDEQTDIFSAITEKVLDTIRGWDPRRATLGTFVGVCSRTAIDNYFVSNQLVRSPAWVRSLEKMIYKLGPKTLDELCEETSLPRDVLLMAIGFNEKSPEIEATVLQRHGMLDANLKPTSLMTEVVKKREGLPLEAISRVSGFTYATVEKVSRGVLGNGGRRVVHLADAVGDDSDTELGDLLPELRSDFMKSFNTPESRAELIERVIGFLPPRYGMILRRRFLDGDTLETIGEDNGLTRERVRQLEKEALNTLMDYVNDSNTVRSGADKGRIYMEDLVVYSGDDAEGRFDDWFFNKFRWGKDVDLEERQKRFVLFKTFLGLNSENGFVRVPAKVLYESLASSGKDVGYDVKQFRVFIGDLLSSLNKHLSRLPADQRFLVSVNKQQAFMAAAQVLKGYAGEYTD